MSVYSMMFMGMAPIGSLLAGAAASRLGAPITVTAGGLICMTAAGVFWARLPGIRMDARRLIAEQQSND
jgi:fucose permease